MDESSSNREEALLLGGEIETVKKKSVLVLLLKWILEIAMWAIFIAWVALMFYHATQSGDDFFKQLVSYTSGTFWGPSGGAFLLMGGPILLITLLSIPYLIINRDDQPELCLTIRKKSSKKPRIGLWTFPVLVDGAYGVVSAAEFIGIFLFYVFVVWAVSTSAERNLERVSTLDLTPSEKRIRMADFMGVGIGGIGLFCLAFMFVPVARGSLLLRLIDIPFEHAIRYHIWLGHLITLIFAIHGFCYLTIWTIEGILLYQILDWKEVGIANLAGVVVLITLIMMWVTSLPSVRKRNFEMFYYTHQLYIVFVVLLAVHVGDYYFSMAAAGIFLFMLDRFLRFWQSRKSVDVVSAKCLPYGIVALLFSKPKYLRYNALSFIFVKIGEVSRLQWHPFSVSSSPLDGKNHISILIKNLGDWTQKLSRSISKMCEEAPNSKLIIASIEGPYGHEAAYYLKYENLILVAGGIGISPFLAILEDILHRTRIHGERSSPRNVLVIWAVKTSKEISLLSTVNMDSISPNLFLQLRLNIHIYVTRETNPHVEEGTVGHKQTTDSYVYERFNDNNNNSKRNGEISVLVGTSDNTIWYGVYVILCIIGFAIILGLVDVYYIQPGGSSSKSYRGFLFLGSMVATVFIFGGFFIFLWNFLKTKTLSENDEININSTYQLSLENNNEEVAANSSYTMIQYGSRPDFKEIFERISKEWGNVDVGVIVCGPSSLDSAVAKEIRSHTLRRESNYPVFHFHTHSFDL